MFLVFSSSDATKLASIEVDSQIESLAMTDQFIVAGAAAKVFVFSNSDGYAEVFVVEVNGAAVAVPYS